MHKTWCKWIVAVGATLAHGIGAVSSAHEGHVHGTTPHGGTMEMTKHYHFEVVCVADGIKVYVSGMDNKPLDATKLGGTATFYHPSSPKPWFDRPLRGATSSLNLSMNLSKLPPKGAKVAIQVTGLPDPDEPESTVTVPFTVMAAVPARITFAKATSADQAAVNSQKVCKITGEDLFAMGGPVKVARGDQSVFVCCQGCIKTIQANPDKYLGTAAVSGTTKTK
jgi:hypothetical protein